MGIMATLQFVKRYEKGHRLYTDRTGRPVLVDDDNNAAPVDQSRSIAFAGNHFLVPVDDGSANPVSSTPVTPACAFDLAYVYGLTFTTPETGIWKVDRA